jgi:thiol-disulfide isomerase/thioredoxin
MKKLYFTLFLVLQTATTFATKDSLALFSTAVQKNIKTYVRYSNKAYNKKDIQKAHFLFDSLVNETLIGTRFDDFSFRRIGKKKLQLSTIQLPTIIYTYASWCVMDKGEIPALNKLSQEYKGTIKIIVVFWDKKQNMKKIARKFNSQIEVCYAHQDYDNDIKAVQLLKNGLGFPTSYYLDSNRVLVDLKKRSLQPTYNIDLTTSTENCIVFFNTEIKKLLLSNSLNKTQLVKF